MAFADTANSSLAYVEEVTFDTPPTTGFKLLRNTGESLNTGIDTAQSDEIDADRQFTGTVQVAGSSAGDVNLQLSYGEYDDFLEAVLQSANWSAGYSDTITAVATRVCTVTSTVGLKCGVLIKITGLTVTADDGVFTVESVADSTTFTVVETITDEAVATAAAANDGTIENASVDRSFCFEKNFIVDAVDNYFLMSGLKASSLSLSMAAGAIVNGSVSFSGATGAGSATSQEAGSYLPVGTNELMNGVSNVKGLSLNAVDPAGAFTLIAATFQELGLSVDNSLRDQPAVGSLYPAGIGSGRIKVEATSSIYFSSRTIFDEFLVNGSVQLRFQLTDSKDAYGNRYGFVLPELKIASHEVVASGPDSDVMASVTFSAQKDTRSGTAKSIIITRIASA